MREISEDDLAKRLTGARAPLDVIKSLSSIWNDDIKYIFGWINPSNEDSLYQALLFVKTRDESLWIYRTRNIGLDDSVYYIVDSAEELDRLLMQQVPDVDIWQAGIKLLQASEEPKLIPVYKLKANQKGLQSARYNLPPRVTAELLADELLGTN